MRSTRDICRKLAEQRGISMPLALLLFLICALLTSVVIAAGTAAVGRSSNLSAGDQRYYSVVSAAELVQSTFDETRVNISCTQVKQFTRQTSYTESGVTRGSSTDTVEQTTLFVNGTQIATASGDGTLPISLNGLTLPERSAVCLLLGSAGGTASASELWSRMATGLAGGSGVELGEFDLTHTISSAPAGIDKTALQNALEVKITEWTLEDGGLQLQFDSAHASEQDDFSSLTLLCGSDFVTSESTEENRATPVDVPADSGYLRTETTTVTTTRNADVSWTSTSLQKTGGSA